MLKNIVLFFVLSLVGGCTPAPDVSPYFSLGDQVVITGDVRVGVVIEVFKGVWGWRYVVMYSDRKLSKWQDELVLIKRMDWINRLPTSVTESPKKDKVDGEFPGY